MSGKGNLQADPLFQGLTRPPMLLGVSYLFFMLNMGSGMITFINVHSIPLLIIMLFGGHAFGYFLCKEEPLAVELFQKRYGKCMRSRNRRFFGFCNSYDLY